MSNAITERQAAFLTKLIYEREGHQGPTEEMISRMSSYEASQAISYMLTFPYKRTESTTPQVSVEEGFYVLNGDIYRVRESKMGRLYALMLNTETGKFDYAPGHMLKMGEAVALTEEVAAEFGHRYGICAICGRLLSNEESVSRGIGSVCWKKFHGK